MSRLTSIAALLLLLVLFFGINVFVRASMRGARLDMTENNLYTISRGSRNIASAIDEPVRLKFYFSRSLASGRPTLETYGTRVRELLEEYERAADGQIILEVIDPVPFSEAEDQAVQAGLVGLPAGGGDSFYFGLVGTNAVDGREVIPFFDPQQEQFLEYEISRLLYTLSNPDRKVVGVLTSLPLDGAPPTNPMMQQQPSPPWQIWNEMRELFELRRIRPGQEDLINGELDVLMVVHPKALTDRMVYAIDQYVLRGGHAILFVDPHCEAQPLPPGAQQNPMMALEADRSSNLPRLLAAWGLKMPAGMVTCDREHAIRVSTGRNRAEQVPYVAYLNLDGEAIDAEDSVTGRLESINIATGGSLEREEGASTAWEPLLETSEQSMRIEVDKIKFMPDPKQLLADFVSIDTRLVLAARVTGPAESAFQARPEDPDAGDDGEQEAQAAEHLAASQGDINVIVVADADMLSDRLWVQEERLFGQIRLGYRKLADNGDMVVNALDNLAGSTDLISIRARGQYSRPFTKVEQIQRSAEEEYLAEEQRLQEKLRETERKLNELQAARTDAGEGQLILTPEQQAELEKFNEQRVETRRQLRAVQLNLRKDIERLGTWLKVINIGAVPAALIIVAVTVGLYRVARYRRDVRRA